jgi:hypothetical protein
MYLFICHTDYNYYVIFSKFCLKNQCSMTWWELSTLLQWHQHSYLLWKIRCILVFPALKWLNEELEKHSSKNLTMSNWPLQPSMSNRPILNLDPLTYFKLYSTDPFEQACQTVVDWQVVANYLIQKIQQYLKTRYEVHPGQHMFFDCYWRYGELEHLVFWLLLKVWRVGTLSLLWLLYCAHSFAKFTRGLLNVQGQGTHYSLWSKVRYYNLVTPHWKHLPFMHHLGRCWVAL